MHATTRTRVIHGTTQITKHVSVSLAIDFHYDSYGLGALIHRNYLFLSICFLSHSIVSEKFKAKMKNGPEKEKDGPMSAFHVNSVDGLLLELVRKFPIPGVEIVSGTAGDETSAATASTSTANQTTTATTTDAQPSNPQAVKLSTTANGPQANNGTSGDSRPSKIQRTA